MDEQVQVTPSSQDGLQHDDDEDDKFHDQDHLEEVEEVEGEEQLNLPPGVKVPSSAQERLSEYTYSLEDHDEAEHRSHRGSEKQETKSQSHSHSRSSEQDKENGVRHMQKFTLYETLTRYYIVGSDLTDTQYRLLKIDKTVDAGELSITEDEVVYNKSQLARLIAAIEDGNIAHGGLSIKNTMSCILGFIRFTGAYYMLVVTKKSHIAIIGGHYVYKVDATELIPITSSIRKPDKNSEEARFMAILGNLDLTRYFYFSYSYDITRTLQHNITKSREALAAGLAQPQRNDYNDMFAWNHYLLKPALGFMNNSLDWCMPLLYGFIDQAKLSVYGRPIYLTIIARRSRHFAGARFLKRGANDLGYVANDVETEQIVSDMLTTSFHASGGRLYGNPNYTSYVQHRGSIPLYWTQEPSPSTPKPPITLNLVDPFFSAAALHFDDLFQRYGCPVIVLNLVKSIERVPRESILLNEFTQSITYLNQLLPKEKKIRYIAWDMSRASKSRDQDVIGRLEAIAKGVVKTTGFFHNGYGDVHPPQVQNGVCRTNCIDCLDRTNAAQFVIGKRALGHQLHALGVIKDTNVDYDTDAMNLFTHMYHDHGDTIALQYGGSHLVNTMETYRKINQWTSHSRDMIESFKRYYNNSFLDGQRQEAINLFLGNYIFTKGQPMLWDLETDYYLHHVNPASIRKRRSYTKWWTPDNLKERALPPTLETQGLLSEKPIAFFDEFWLEYYKPRALSSFTKVFAYQMNSQLKYLPIKKSQDNNDRWNVSPFIPRSSHNDSHSPRSNKSSMKQAVKKGRSMKSVKLLDSSDISTQLKKLNLQRWLQTGQAETKSNLIDANNRGTRTKRPDSPTKTATLSEKTVIPKEQWTVEQLVQHSLSPAVSDPELKEYDRYISHPLNLAPVISSTPEPRVFVNYVDSTSPEAVADLQPKVEDLKLYEEYVGLPDVVVFDGSESRHDETQNLRFKAYQSWLNMKGFR